MRMADDGVANIKEAPVAADPSVAKITVLGGAKAAVKATDASEQIDRNGHVIRGEEPRRSASWL